MTQVYELNKPLKIKHLYHFCPVPGGQELAHSELAPKDVKWVTGWKVLLLGAIRTRIANLRTLVWH